VIDDSKLSKEVEQRSWAHVVRWDCASNLEHDAAGALYLRRRALTNGEADRERRWSLNGRLRD
jgi:hypothetical protein